MRIPCLRIFFSMAFLGVVKGMPRMMTVRPCLRGTSTEEDRKPPEHQHLNDTISPQAQSRMFIERRWRTCPDCSAPARPGYTGYTGRIRGRLGRAISALLRLRAKKVTGEVGNIRSRGLGALRHGPVVLGLVGGLRCCRGCRARLLLLSLCRLVLGLLLLLLSGLCGASVFIVLALQGERKKDRQLAKARIHTSTATVNP